MEEAAFLSSEELAIALLEAELEGRIEYRGDEDDEEVRLTLKGIDYALATVQKLTPKERLAIVILSYTCDTIAHEGGNVP